MKSKFDEGRLYRGRAGTGTRVNEQARVQSTGRRKNKEHYTCRQTPDLVPAVSGTSETAAVAMIKATGHESLKACR